MKQIKDLKDLMLEQMRDLYHGEKKLEGLLPLMIANATEPRLQAIFEKYAHSNKDQIMHLRQAFEPLYELKRGEVCEAMLAMIKEGHDLIDRIVVPEVKDAGLITALQHIIHYQIAGYGAVCTYAQMLGYEDIADLMHLNLEVEKLSDRMLAILAEEVINERAIVHLADA